MSGRASITATALSITCIGPRFRQKVTSRARRRWMFACRWHRQKRRAVRALLPGCDRFASLAALEAVEDQVQGELELELIVAAGAHDRRLVVLDLAHDLGDVRVGLGHLLQHEGLHLGALYELAAVVEELLAEAQHAAPEDVHRVVQQVDREPTLQEDASDAIHVLHHGWARLPSRDDDPRCPRMAQHRAPGRQDPGAERRFPLADFGRAADLAEDDVDHPVEDVLLVRDVVVEGHRFHAELCPQAPHADRVDPLAVRQINGGRQDSLARQGPPPFDRRTRLRRHTATLRTSDPSLDNLTVYVQTYDISLRRM